MELVDDANVTKGFEEVINDIEMCMLKRFETLRNLLRDQQRLWEDIFSGDTERGTSAVLEMERRRIADERLHEKTQIHTAMQQLTEAWLRLETEEKRGQPTQSESAESVSDTESSESGEAWIWGGGETPSPPQTETKLDIARQLPERGPETQPTACSVGHNPSQAADLFFKLRSDMRKYAGLT
jgi:hypothetical protein